MIDRFNNAVRIGWPDHHLVWLQAAMELPRVERTAAFQDIADMTGRDIGRVRDKAYAMERDRLASLQTKRVMVPARHMQVSSYPALPPMRMPTRKQLMGAR